MPQTRQSIPSYAHISAPNHLTNSSTKNTTINTPILRPQQTSLPRMITYLITPNTTTISTTKNTPRKTINVHPFTTNTNLYKGKPQTITTSTTIRNRPPPITTQIHKHQRHITNTYLSHCRKTFITRKTRVRPITTTIITILHLITRRTNPTIRATIINNQSTTHMTTYLCLGLLHRRRSPNYLIDSSFELALGY